MSVLYCIRESVAIAASKEIITAGIKSLNVGIYTEEAVMIAAFSVLGFMINGASFYLDFSGT